MKLSVRTAAIALMCTALVAGCGSDSESGIEVRDPWARTSSTVATNGAAYMVLQASSDDALVGVSVDESVAARAEIHETVAAGDMEEMEDMDSTGDDMSSTTMDMSSTTMDMSSTTMDMTSTTDGATPSTQSLSIRGAHEGEDHSDMPMTMREVESIELPAGEDVTLEPGGYHVMLLDLADPLEDGDEFDLELTFESGETQTVAVPVRDEAP